MFMSVASESRCRMEAVRCIDSLRMSGGCATGVPGESGRLLPLEE